MYSCTSTFTKTNYINIDTPVAAFTMDDSVASCRIAVHFTFGGSYYKSVLWNFGPGIGVSDSLNPNNCTAFRGLISRHLLLQVLVNVLLLLLKKVQIFGLTERSIIRRLEDVIP